MPMKDLYDTPVSKVTVTFTIKHSEASIHRLMNASYLSNCPPPKANEIYQLLLDIKQAIIAQAQADSMTPKARHTRTHAKTFDQMEAKTETCRSH